jgi:site-specific recombinase XerD
MPEVTLASSIESFLNEQRVDRGLSPLNNSAYRRDLAQFEEHAGNRWRDDPQPLLDFVDALQ